MPAASWSLNERDLRLLTSEVLGARLDRRIAMSTPVGALHGYQVREPVRPSPSLDHWRRPLAFFERVAKAIGRVLADLAREPAFLTLPLDSSMEMGKPLGVLQANIHRKW
jgi:hypothetical protein